MKYQVNNSFVNLILALCVFCVALGCNASDGNSDSSSDDDAPVATIEHWKLLREYSDNEVNADARYRGKRLRVTGPMDFVQVENGKMIGRFSVPAWSYKQLFCEFSESQRDAVAGLQAGQQVVVEGTCRGLSGMGRLTLSDCALK
ncbi:MAG: hypothetical protein WCB68_05415 [Pyrinomonadaceae bacterium]